MRRLQYPQVRRQRVFGGLYNTVIDFAEVKQSEGQLCLAAGFNTQKKPKTTQTCVSTTWGNFVLGQCELRPSIDCNLSDYNTVGKKACTTLHDIQNMKNVGKECTDMSVDFAYNIYRNPGMKQKSNDDIA
ncbi:unnamed protein product [Lepeophtheirus salmonis]|uniref:(salmon louse) hypothetical protein n=1 Tax=Lepeophtheirus salmonis TaxID=72036 RepID=A0A7R8CJE0_LEPSM|nr:unnamed protein product [Lepeophtheirus salmonis]CAF2841456.1 unnamed protein product [Lepeophtheirus salmonis]